MIQRQLAYPPFLLATIYEWLGIVCTSFSHSVRILCPSFVTQMNPQPPVELFFKRIWTLFESTKGFASVGQKDTRTLQRVFLRNYRVGKTFHSLSLQESKPGHLYVFLTFLWYTYTMYSVYSSTSSIRRSFMSTRKEHQKEHQNHFPGSQHSFYSGISSSRLHGEIGTPIDINLCTHLFLFIRASDCGRNEEE